MKEDFLSEIFRVVIIETSQMFIQLFRPYLKYIVLFLLIRLILFLNTIRKKQQIRRKIHALASHTEAITPQQFFKIRNKSFGGRGNPHYSNRYTFTGVYILHNETKDLYYVGQGKNVLNRINRHFTGNGNGDVYADYKYNDSFTIQAIALDGSGFKSLDKLERYAIETYDAYQKGYNRNRGNRL